MLNNTIHLKNICLLNGSRCSVTLQNGKIEDLKPAEKSPGDYVLSPGLIDIHTHGIEKYSFEYPDQLCAGAAALPKYGVTAFLPTIVPDTSDKHFFKKLSALADALDRIDQVHIPGFHLEGPFVAISGAACQLCDGDVSLLQDMVAACAAKVAAVSVAPEVKNIIPVIEWLTEHHIVPFITHTKADVDQTVKAIAAGARHATHFYDVFYAPEAADGGVRPVGCVEAFLADKRCSVDFIADGVHVHPMAVKAALAAKGYENIILITDANIGAGLPAGIYDSPWGFKIKVAPGAGARIEDPDNPHHGGLAGSALTMNVGVNNLRQWLDLPAEQIFAMAAANPARLLHLRHKGKIQPGYDADLVLWKKLADGAYQTACTLVAGKIVYQDQTADLAEVIIHE